MGEFNIARDGCDVRLDHSSFFRYSLTGISNSELDACIRIGYLPSDFQTSLLDARADRSVWLLSFWSDAVFAIYRHSKTGITVPYMLPKWHDQTKSVFEADLDALLTEPERTIHKSRVCALRQEFEYLGLIGERRFREHLGVILQAVPRGTKVFILGANEEFLEPGTNIRHRHEAFKRLNTWTRRAARFKPNVAVLNIRDFIENDQEVRNWTHFDRTVYMRIYREIERYLTV